LLIKESEGLAVESEFGSFFTVKFYLPSWFKGYRLGTGSGSGSVGGSGSGAVVENYETVQDILK
jgi:hypothetical protein